MRHVSFALCAVVFLSVAPGCGLFRGHAATTRLQSTLDIFWTDVEGGAATLIVTPAGESILIDAGRPGQRDPGRILSTLTGIAGLTRLDHMVVTHFDIDHFGGVADLAEQIPILNIYDPGIPEEHMRRFPELRIAYERAAEGRRTILKAGDTIKLRGRRGTPPVTLRCLAAKQAFVPAPQGAPTNDTVCATHQPKDEDTSENANSIVLVLDFGTFRFLDAADLTWNLESRLVCPHDLVGQVDVYQANHHGLDLSNNPVLVRTVRPKVAVVNNGPRKGCDPGTFATLRSTPSIESIYQIHRNVRVGDEGNTSPDMIANEDEDCSAELITLSVAPDGMSYTVSVPSTAHRATYRTWSAPDVALRE